MRFVIRVLNAGCLAAVILGVLYGVGFGRVGAASASGEGQAAPARLSAELTCLPGGGAEIALTIRNVGPDLLTLRGDVHLLLGAVRPGGQEPLGFYAVFPPEGGFAPIAPGGEQTFRLPVGGPSHGEPGPDLDAGRLVLKVEAWFAGRDRGVTRHFSFPGCAA